MKHLIGPIYFETDKEGYYNFGRYSRWGNRSDVKGPQGMAYFVRIFSRFYLLVDYQAIARDF
jgi:hypothetical protein